MIALLNGRLARKDHDSLIVDVSGVGYRVFVSPRTLDTYLGTETDVSLEIHTIVREDEISLYGFRDPKECRFFTLLLTVSGVGPKMAMNILSHARWQDLVEAIRREDSQDLRSIRGIGEKTAKLIVMTLAKKMAEFGPGMNGVNAQGSLSSHSSTRSDAFSALASLGYHRTEIQRALESIPGEHARTEALVREALRVLSGTPSGGRAL